MENKKIPVNIISGYLGSGKTTLLKNILKKPEEKIAVLMNEFGDIGIDTKIIRGENVEIKELLGGCVCCSLTGEFELAIKEILEKVKPERIVVEMTGVAEPDLVMFNMENMEGIYLDSVLTVVDADALVRFPKIGHVGKVQIENANMLILNKLDLVKAEDIDRIEHLLNGMNPGATIVKATYSNVDVGMLFGLEFDHPPIKKHDIHAPLFTESFIYKSSRMHSRSMFQQFLLSIPEEIVRIKGHVRMQDGYYILNFVNGRYDLLKSGDEEIEIVFIGDNIMRLKDKILDDLGKCQI